VIIYKFTQGNLGAKKIPQKLISVASQEKKSQIVTLATDIAIPVYEYVVESLLGFNATGRESADLVALTAKNCCFEVFSCFRLQYSTPSAF
jgi:hypothetical protein